MFRTTTILWNRYCSIQGSAWSRDHPLTHLSAEVRERLQQLDLILNHLGRALNSTAVDPNQPRRLVEWEAQAKPLLESGLLSQGEYVAGFTHSREEMGAIVNAWAEVRLFTETFYFVAFRIREILNGPSPRAFPCLRKLDAKSIRDVRNLLIEHPEDRRPIPDFRQRLLVTADGPALKTAEASFRDGRTMAAECSLDKGLYVNVEEFRAEIEALLIAALTEGRPTR